jgi:hypothetical protein
VRRSSRAPALERSTTAVVLVAALSGACRQPVVLPQAAPTQATEEHCWWAVLRTTLPPDSVAIRFQRGFNAVGLTDAMWTSSADTSWARGGPTSIAGATYQSRAVAYRRGDSTHFRHFVTVVPQPSDTVSVGGRHIAMCGGIARATAIPTSVPREPTGEETLRVWSRKP